MIFYTTESRPTLMFIDFQHAHVKTHFLLENLWISEQSLDTSAKCQHRLALPNTELCCIIFESDVLVAHVCFQIYLDFYANGKILIKNFWNPCKYQILLMLLQGVLCEKIINCRFWCWTANSSWSLFSLHPCHE